MYFNAETNAYVHFIRWGRCLKKIQYKFNFDERFTKDWCPFTIYLNNNVQFGFVKKILCSEEGDFWPKEAENK